MLEENADHDGEPIEPFSERRQCNRTIWSLTRTTYRRPRRCAGMAEERIRDSRHVVQPPLADERAVMLRASWLLRKGQHVLITGDVAKPIAEHLMGINPDAKPGRALEDIAEGNEGRVSGFSRKD